MPKFISFHFAFLFVATEISGQNWSLVPTGDTLHFQHQDSLVISHTVFVDSLKILSNGDSVFYLNRVVSRCGTCSEPARLRNQGQFLQKTMTKTLDGRQVFSGQNKFVWLQNSPTNSVWLFDTAANLSAKVAETFWGKVLDEADSLKKIQFSDGREMLVSKNHGLVASPDFAGDGRKLALVGIKNRNLGTVLPKWSEFVDFQVGDIFQRYFRVWDVPNVSTHSETFLKQTILGKNGRAIP